jgi:Na+/melibiose symporter-like transporter
MAQDFGERPQKMRVAFSVGEIGDGVAYQTFSFLVFTFYFSVVKLPIQWISMGFIIWSIWNSINDPLIGFLSDKTKNKRYGRRIPWMIGSTIPLGIIMILLFTPPLYSTSNGVKFAYFLFVLFLFDSIYTMFNLNYNSLFSEIFISVKDRSEVGRIRGIFVIVSLRDKNKAEKRSKIYRNSCIKHLGNNTYYLYVYMGFPFWHNCVDGCRIRIRGIHLFL